MKTLGLYMVAFIAIVGCSKKERKKDYDMAGDSIIVYSSNMYDSLLRKNKSLKLKTIDTFCNTETERAQKDIKENRLFLFTDETVFEKDEMAHLLKKYNIGLKSRLYSHIRSNNKFEFYCYDKTMQGHVYKQLGSKFIDSLWLAAERNYVIKNPDKPYIKDGIDLRKKYLKK